MSVGGQAYIFLWSIIGGMAISFLYDTFRIKRKVVNTNIKLIYVEDILYWVIAAFVLFLTVYYSNDGELRGFIFVAILIGVGIYALVFSKLVILCSLWVLKFIHKVLKTLWAIVSFPFRIIIKGLAVPTRFIMIITIKASKRSKTITKNRIAKSRIWVRMLRNIRKKI